MQYLLSCLAAHEGIIACVNTTGLDENGNPIEVSIASDNQQTYTRLTSESDGLYRLYCYRTYLHIFCRAGDNKNF